MPETRGLLNDNVIYTYLRLITSRSDENINLPTVFAFDTLFYSQLKQKGQRSSLLRSLVTRAKFKLFIEVKDSVPSNDAIFVKEVISNFRMQVNSNEKLPSFFKDIEADGNRLYRSLAEAIYGEEYLHPQVRKEMTAFLLNNSQKPFARFFTAFGNRSATVEEYATHFNQPSDEPAHWGTSQQFILAAKLYEKI
uniref:Uncharacterized protein n=1 Tax=Ditylenchus dipsaci TaxID=166011 RepID=A0A915CUL9_9BILA